MARTKTGKKKRKATYHGFKSKKQWRQSLGFCVKTAVGAGEGAQDEGWQSSTLPQTSRF